MDQTSANKAALQINDFVFRHFDKLTVKDAIVVHNPPEAYIKTPVLLRSTKSLEEHIAYIRDHDVKKACVVAEDIRFLLQCPGLEYIQVYPSLTAESFDYSLLYDMPNLKWVSCEVEVGMKSRVVGSIDYSRMKGIQHLCVSGSEGHLNVEKAESVTSLIFDFGYPKTADLRGMIPGKSLRSFSVNQAPIQTLEGIQDAPQLQRLELSNNRKLTDISALSSLKKSLRYLEIDTCGKIRDFSVLAELENLEYLILKGSNPIPNLIFLDDMPKLKYLHFTMNAESGDLSPCLRLNYARIQNRKHYSHKDSDMPKAYTDPDEAYPFTQIQ